MKTNFLSILLSAATFLLLADAAFAAPAGIYSIDGPGTKGLCTEKDKGEKWVDEEWCKTIYDQITGRENQGGDGELCASDLFAELKEKISNGQFEGLEEFCPKYQTLLQTQPDRDAFIAGLLQQIISTLVIMESGWDNGAEGVPITSTGEIVGGATSVKTDGPKGKETVSVARAQGLMQLSAESVGSDIYKCGCKDVSSDQQLKDDPKLNLKCGTHIAMYWMVKDSELGSGSGNEGAKGIAQYFQPFRDIDKEKKEKMQWKVRTYCDNLDYYQPAGSEGGTGTSGNNYADPIGVPSGRGQGTW